MMQTSENTKSNERAGAARPPGAQPPATPHGGQPVGGGPGAETGAVRTDWIDANAAGRAASAPAGGNPLTPGAGTHGAADETDYSDPADDAGAAIGQRLQAALDRLGTRFDRYEREYKDLASTVQQEVQNVQLALSELAQRATERAGAGTDEREPGGGGTANWIEVRAERIWQVKVLQTEVEALKEQQAGSAAYAKDWQESLDAVTKETEQYAKDYRDLASKAAQANGGLADLAGRLERIDEALFGTVTRDYLDAFTEAYGVRKGNLDRTEQDLAAAETAEHAAAAAAASAKVELDDLQKRRERIKALTAEQDKALKAADQDSDADRYAQAIVRVKLAQGLGSITPPSLEELQVALHAARNKWLTARQTLQAGHLAAFKLRRQRDDLKALLTELDGKRAEWTLSEVAALPAR